MIQMKLCLLLAACVCGYPLQEEMQNTANKNYKKYIPTVADVKLLEKEIWKAASTGDLSRALKLENRLETDVLRATLVALARSKKDPIRSKRDLRELGVVVRRDKRTVKFLSSVMTAGAQTGLNLLLGNNKIEETTPENRTLIRIPRQGKPYTFPKKLPSKLFRRRADTLELTNDIIPPTISPTSSPTTLSPTTLDPTDTSITSTTPAVDDVTTPAVTDAVTADTNREEVTPSPRKPARQEEEEDEDEGGGGLGGLITSFLGSLSTPEGGVDLDAVTGLLGGISTQNDDGSYDFTGLQDTVGSLFGGSEEGGSNIGLFLGGLLGAVIRGSAGDDAAKGAGRLAGNILTAILPGLSAYPTPEEDGDAKPMEGLDSGGFLSGFLSTVIGGLSGASNSNSSGGGDGGGEKPGSGSILQIKFKLFRAVFSILTKILGASSSSKQQPKYGTQYYGPPPPQNQK